MSTLYNVRPAHELIVRHKGLTYPFTCTFGQATLEIDEGVFCPTLSQTSSLLLQSIEFRPDHRVLDVFSGSGAFGINAALAGCDVVMVDISPSAAACACRNAILNGVDAKIEIRCGSIDNCLIPDEEFQLVIANPPLLPGIQTNVLSMAIFDPGLQSTVNFVRAMRRHLASTGECYLLTSDVLERLGLSVERLCTDNALEASLIDKMEAGYECYRVHRIRR